MTEEPCLQRGGTLKMDRCEPYMAAQRNQGNGGTIPSAVADFLLDDLE
jgi:hypothetical protein